MLVRVYWAGGSTIQHSADELKRSMERFALWTAEMEQAVIGSHVEYKM